MAITIELWTSEGLVGGAERWWDDVEATLRSLDPTHATFPLVSRIDPYGDATFAQPELAPLRDELERFAAATPPPRVAEIVTELIGLCKTALEADTAELRFVGD